MPAARPLLTPLAAVVLALAGLLVVPAALPAMRILPARDDPAALVGYRLAGLSAADYARAVDAALGLADGAPDIELAASLVDLARQRGVELSPDLAARVAAAVAADDTGSPRRALDGFISGRAPTEAALAGAVAADLSGFGDLRDLALEAGKLVAGEPVDELTVALAATGLALTGATIASFGGAAPAKAGASAVKAAHRLGRLSAPLRRQLATLAREAIDTGALRQAAVAAGRLDLAGARAVAAGVLRPGPAASLRMLAADVATLGGKTGYRSTLRLLDGAADTRHVSRLARVADRFGKGSVAALSLAGSAALGFAGVAASVLGWLALAAAWALSLAVALARLAFRLARGLRALAA